MSQVFWYARIGMMVAVPLGGVLWLGMGSGEQYYDVPPSEVRRSLSDAVVPTHVLGSYVTGSRVTRPDGRTVVTALLDEDGRELMRFVTTVRASGEGSSVSTALEPPVGSKAGKVSKAMQSQPVAMSLMKKLADEHVDAAIEKRPFNMMAFNPAGDAMMGALPGLREQVDAANESAAMMARAEQEQHRRESWSKGWGSQKSGGANGWGEPATAKGGGWGAKTPKEPKGSGD